jgi:hypothetical protein
VLFSAPSSPRERVDGQQARVRLGGRHRPQCVLETPTRSASASASLRVRGLRGHLDEQVRVRAVRGGALSKKASRGGTAASALFWLSSLRCPASFAAVAWHLAAVAGLYSHFSESNAVRAGRSNLPAIHGRATVVISELKGRAIPKDAALRRGIV